jgi:hypothetical protein
LGPQHVDVTGAATTVGSPQPIVAMHLPAAYCDFDFGVVSVFSRVHGVAEQHTRVTFHDGG